MPKRPRQEIPACAKRVPIFQWLPAEALAELGPTMRHRQLDRGDVIAHAGESVNQLLVVADGRLKVTHTTAGGREQVVRTLGPGEFTGELALFVPTNYDGDVVAQEPTTVCLVEREVVQSLLRRFPELSQRLVVALAERLIAAERRIADLGMRDVGQRLAAELLRLAASGAPTPGGVRLRLPFTWSELAHQLGTTPESLSRRLRTLIDEGVIRQASPRVITVVSLDRLQQLAET